MIGRCDADTLSRLILGPDEVAVLDVRELAHYGRENVLWSSNLPLGRLELEILYRVPRRSTSVVLIDDGVGLAEHAAFRLELLGYSDLRILEGGIRSWREAGHTLHWETEVAVKGFSGFAERHGAPEFIEPETLKSQLARGEGWVVLDSRPPDEYRRGNIPGSIDAPGAQALRSFFDLVPDPNMDVVINCATRTRGILGALMLRAAGVPNRVHVLNNGTRGWMLAGYELETDASRFSVAPSVKARERVRNMVGAMLSQAGIARINSSQLAQMWRDPARTTYLLDVRDPDEYAAGHLPTARNAPFGSLVMSPEGYVSTLNSNVVLTDDDGIRAGVSAVWLAQIGGCTPFVLAGGSDEEDFPDGGDRVDVCIVPAQEFIGLESVTPLALKRRLKKGFALVLDLSSSEEYLRSHVPGAAWLLRSELSKLLPELVASGRDLVVTAEAPEMAKIVAAEIAQLCDIPTHVLDGGNPGWRAAGFVSEVGPVWLLSERIDRWLQSGDRPNPRESMRKYLAWECGLLNLLEREGLTRYRNLLWR